MSLSILSDKLNSQPLGPLKIDWSNLITRGLALSVSGVNPGVNNVTGKAVANTHAPTVAIGVRGPGLSWSNTANIGLQVDSTELLSGSAGNYAGGLTLLVLANPAAASGIDMMFSMAGGTAETYVTTNSNQAFSSRPGDLSVIMSAGGGGATATGVIDGNVHAFVLVFPAGSTTPSIYVDGVDHSSLQVAGTAFSSSGGRDYVGGWSANGYAVNGYKIFETLGWNRALSPAEIGSVSAKVKQVYAPWQRRLWAVAVAGGGGAVLASTASATPSASAALTTAINLAATAGAAASPTATLTTGIVLAASASATPTASASLTTAVQLAATNSAKTASSASLTTQIALQSSAAASPAASATLTAPGQAMAASVSATPSSSAVLTTGIVLQSSASASPSASAVLTAPGQGLASSASATPSGSASLTTGISLSSANSAAAQATATLLTVIRLSSSAQAQPGSSAALSTGTAAWTASNTARCIASANLTTQILMAASASARPGGSGDLVAAGLLVVNSKRIVSSSALARSVGSSALSRTVTY